MAVASLDPLFATTARPSRGDVAIPSGHVPTGNVFKTAEVARFTRETFPGPVQSPVLGSTAPLTVTRASLSVGSIATPIGFKPTGTAPITVKLSSLELAPPGFITSKA